MIATMTSPVRTSRMPALTPKVFSMVSSKTRNSAAPQMPGMQGMPEHGQAMMEAMQQMMQEGMHGGMAAPTDEERARRFFLHYVGGGTDYPFKLLRKWAEETRDVIRVIISDSDFLSNVQNPTTSLKPLDTLQFAADRSRLLVAFLACAEANARTFLAPALKHPRFRLAIVKSFDGFARAAAELSDALFGG